MKNKLRLEERRDDFGSDFSFIIHLVGLVFTFFSQSVCAQQNESNGQYSGLCFLNLLWTA